jgi:hypothetical protein
VKPLDIKLRYSLVDLFFANNNNSNSGDNAEALQIRWSDNTTSEYSFAWLRKHAYDTKQSNRSSIVQELAEMRALWNDATLRSSGGMPSLSFREVMDDDTGVMELFYVLLFSFFSCFFFLFVLFFSLLPSMTT